ncbi:IS66 family transposase [Bradyrhizobium sp. BRP14]|nr:IS66 family transposase [Bradyrhizobium sp. BRP14]
MSHASLSEENAALKALLAQTQAALAEHQVALAQSEEARRRLEAIVSDLQRDKFGSKSEKLSREQFNLPLEDIEIAQGVLDAAQERAEAIIKGKRQPTDGPRRNRGHLPAHLPRVEQIIEPESTLCPCGCGEMARIGEDVSERLDRIPAQLRVLVTRRPKYACRRCSGAVVQAHAPERVVPGGLPTEALIAQIIVAKFGDHLPFYRQAEIFKRQGIHIDRASLGNWTGRGCFHLQPIGAQMGKRLAAADRLFMDETTAPVLDPGRRQTKKGYFWAIASDDRGHGGADPPVVLFKYAPGRSGSYAEEFLTGFRGSLLQCDGYDGYDRLTQVQRPQGAWVLVHCWSHLRRRFVKQMRNTKSPIAETAVRQIAALYAIEAMVRGATPDVRCAARQQHSAPIIEALKPWFEKQLSMISSGSQLAVDIRYALNHWDGLTRFLDDGRLELDTNPIENAIRPVALTRKNALFAGHEVGAENWALLASIVATCKLNNVDPVTYIGDTLTAIINGHPQSRIDELMPWRFRKTSSTNR